MLLDPGAVLGSTCWACLDSCLNRRWCSSAAALGRSSGCLRRQWATRSSSSCIHLQHSDYPMQGCAVGIQGEVIEREGERGLMMCRCKGVPVHVPSAALGCSSGCILRQWATRSFSSGTDAAFCRCTYSASHVQEAAQMAGHEPHATSHACSCSSRMTFNAVASTLLLEPRSA